MALHVQMSEDAEKEYNRLKVRGMLSSFGAAAALSLAFGLTLTFTVIYFAQDPPAEFLAYVPPAEDLPPRNQPTTPQLSSKTATPSNTVAPSVIVSTGAAPVAMAQIDVPMEDSMDDGLSIDIGIGLDTGLGEDLGDEGGGMGSSQQSGSSLEGTFYDLKQSKGGAPTKVAVPGQPGKANTNELYAVVSGYLKNWSQSALARYYKAPNKLYAPSFFLPMAHAELAPEAFGCGKNVKAAGWLVVYRGKVKSPVDATIRFVGTGDDFLAVRFNGKLALEGGYRLPSRFSREKPAAVQISGGPGQAYRKAVREGKDKEHKGYEFFRYPGIPTWSNENEIGGLTAGIPIKVREGSVYPIEIAITEEGGKFGFVLMWENMTGNPVAKDGKLIGGKKFYIFRTNFSAPTKEETIKLMGKHAVKQDGKPVLEWPEFDEDSPIWVAVP